MDGTTPSPVHELARAALARLKRAGGGVMVSGGLEISYDGPAMPEAVPPGITSYQTVQDSGPWEGAHRLVVRAPLVVLDVAWNAGEPVRIMGFSRGGWEADLMEPAP